MRRFVPSPAMVVALVALLVALSGSAYAALKIGTANIKDNAVTAKKIAPKSMVDSFEFANVAEESVRIKDFGSFTVGLLCEDVPVVSGPAALSAGATINAVSPVSATVTESLPPAFEPDSFDTPSLAAGNGARLTGSVSYAGDGTRSFSLGRAFVRDGSGKTYLVDVVAFANEDEHRCDLSGKVITGK